MTTELATGSKIRMLTAEDLAPLLGRAVSTIKTDVRRRPNTLPPRLEIPGSRRLLWLEQDVVEWIDQCRALTYRNRRLSQKAKTNRV